MPIVNFNGQESAELAECNIPSPFLLWPTGSTLGLVLAVVGIGVWLGVQHLGYLEFGELRRVARRTVEQPQIFINNLAIGRAIEELKVTSDYDQICRILEAAFTANDFDAFDLRLHRSPDELPEICGSQIRSTEEPCRCWRNPASRLPRERAIGWSLNLDLVATNNHRIGSMTLYRIYSQRDLQFDINLLTSAFPVALADALDRALSEWVQVASSGLEDAALVARAR